MSYYHDPLVHVSMTPPVAEALCDKAGIWQYDGQQQLAGVPVGVWYDAENERWTWALDEATTWAIVRLAEMDFEWEDATRSSQSVLPCEGHPDRGDPT